MRIPSLIGLILAPLLLAACGDAGARNESSYVDPPRGNQVLSPGPADIRTCVGGAPCF